MHTHKSKSTSSCHHDADDDHKLRHVDEQQKAARRARRTSTRARARQRRPRRQRQRRRQRKSSQFVERSEARRRRLSHANGHSLTHSSLRPARRPAAHSSSSSPLVVAVASVAAHCCSLVRRRRGDEAADARRHSPPPPSPDSDNGDDDATCRHPVRSAIFASATRRCRCRATPTLVATAAVQRAASLRRICATGGGGTAVTRSHPQRRQGWRR